MIRTSLLAALLLGAAAAPALAFPIAPVTAKFETQAVQLPITGIDNGDIEDSDADDPAIWVHPTDKKLSRVYGTAKNGGLRIYDLQANGIADIDVDSRDAAPGRQRSRFNNVDVQYGFNLNGERVDLVVATDRGQDKLKVWKINPADGSLTDITRDLPQALFGTDIPLSEQSTGYGLALYRDKAADKLYAIVTQRNEPVVAQFELIAGADGKVSSSLVQKWTFPDTHKGQDLRFEDDSDPRTEWGPQFEGLTVDQRTGKVYAGQESVGVWTIDLKTGVASDAPLIETRGSGDPDTATYGPFFNADSPVSRDIEGLTIYYRAGGEGYLLASSQGAAHGDEATYVDPTGVDDTYAVFNLSDLAYLGSFQVVAGNGIDGGQESDGGDVIGLGLPGFSRGLFIQQDGYNGVNPDGTEDLFGDPSNNNFKFVRWDRIALAGDFNLEIDPRAWDPRAQAAVPAPAALALFGLGALALGRRRRRG